MKVLYDHQVFSFQEYGGISRYFYELINTFKYEDTVDVDICLKFSNNYYISTIDSIKHKAFFPNFQFRGKLRLQNNFNRYFAIKEIKKNDFNIFHPTYYEPYFLNYIGKTPFVLTVYDMIHEKFNDVHNPNDFITKNKKLLTDRASKIIAISESTKKDLIELFGTDEKKIEVVYLGNSMKLPLNNTMSHILPQKYILFVGRRTSYKNFSTFIKAVSLLLKRDNDLYVVSVGGGMFSKIELDEFNSLGILKRVLNFDLNDNELAYFYKNALVFVFPSLYEGFGIPILESFACECPIACSNTSSLPEIAGDAASYFNPYDEKSILNTIEKIIYNKKLAKKLIKKGIHRLETFSCAKTAQETLAIYEKLL